MTLSHDFVAWPCHMTLFGHMTMFGHMTKSHDHVDQSECRNNHKSIWFRNFASFVILSPTSQHDVSVQDSHFSIVVHQESPLWKGIQLPRPAAMESLASGRCCALCGTSCWRGRAGPAEDGGFACGAPTTPWPVCGDEQHPASFSPGSQAEEASNSGPPWRCGKNLPEPRGPDGVHHYSSLASNNNASNNGLFQGQPISKKVYIFCYLC